MTCPDCNSTDVDEKEVTEFFPYADLPNAFSATFPAMTCRTCGFGWRDHRSEEAIDYAMQVYRARLNF